MRSSSAQAVEPAEEALAQTRVELEQLYRSYARTLVGRLRRRFGSETAEDIVQEAFIRASRYGETGTARSPKALLTRIAVNLGIDQARAQTGAVAVGLDVLEAHRGGAVEADQAETLLLKQIVLQLPKPLRDVFILQRFAGMTYAEIAEHCGVSVKTVEWRMSKALALCAAKMSD